MKRTEADRRVSEYMHWIDKHETRDNSMFPGMFLVVVLLLATISGALVYFGKL